jgi:hypothetical protein
MNAHVIGMILLAFYLIFVGLFALTNFEVVYANVFLGVLAIIAGLCLLFAHFRGSGGS